jgi:hypothetical protein
MVKCKIDEPCRVTFPPASPKILGTRVVFSKDFHLNYRGFGLGARISAFGPGCAQSPIRATAAIGAEQQLSVAIGLHTLRRIPRRNQGRSLYGPQYPGESLRDL